MEKNQFSDIWQEAVWDLISWKIETDEMSPTYCLEGFPSWSIEHGWPKQRSMKLLGGQHRDQSTGRPRKLEDMEKNVKEEKAAQRVQRGPLQSWQIQYDYLHMHEKKGFQARQRTNRQNQTITWTRTGPGNILCPLQPEWKDALIFKIPGTLQKRYHLSSETKLALD